MNTPQKLKILSHCNVCGVKYDPAHQKATVIDEIQNHTLLHIRCLNCGTKNLGYIQEEDIIGVTGAATFITELEPAEVKSFLHSKPLSADQVLESYNYLFKD